MANPPAAEQRESRVHPKIVLFGNPPKNFADVVKWFEVHEVDFIMCKSAEEALMELGSNEDCSLLIVDGLNHDDNFVRLLATVRADRRFKNLPVLLAVKKDLPVVNELRETYRINNFVYVPFEEDAFINTCLPYLGLPITRVTKSDVVGTSYSPFTQSRLLVVTANARLLVDVQRKFSKKFRVIEFAQNALAATARLADDYAPSIDVIFVDQSAMKVEEIGIWRKGLARPMKRPSVLLLQPEFDAKALAVLAKVGGVGALAITDSFDDMMHDLLAATGHLSDQLTQIEAMPAVAEEPAVPTPVELDLSQLVATKTDQFNQLFVDIAKQNYKSQYVHKLFTDYEDIAARIIQSATASVVDKSTTVQTLEDSFDVLGSQFSQMLCYSTAMLSVTEIDPSDSSFFVRRVWRYLINQACAFHCLTESYRSTNPELSTQFPFLTGLIQKIGILFFYQAFPRYDAIRNQELGWDLSGVRQCNWEKQEFGLAHVQLSHEFSKRWDLDHSTYEAIYYLPFQKIVSHAHKVVINTAALYGLANYIAHDDLFKIKPAGSPTEEINFYCSMLSISPDIISSMKEKSHGLAKRVLGVVHVGR